MVICEYEWAACDTTQYWINLATIWTSDGFTDYPNCDDGQVKMVKVSEGDRTPRNNDQINKQSTDLC